MTISQLLCNSSFLFIRIQKIWTAEKERGRERERMDVWPGDWFSVPVCSSKKNGCMVFFLNFFPIPNFLSFFFFGLWSQCPEPITYIYMMLDLDGYLYCTVVQLCFTEPLRYEEREISGGYASCEYSKCIRNVHIYIYIFFQCPYV